MNLFQEMLRKLLGESKVRRSGRKRRASFIPLIEQLEDRLVPSATFVGTNTSAEGNWEGVYGSQGYDLSQGPAHLPSYAAVRLSGNGNYTASNSTTDPRALQVPGTTNRLAASWFSGTSFNIDLNLTDGQSHQVALYALDWSKSGRSERMDVLDAATGKVLNSETVSGFQNGEYIVWDISGNVDLRVSNLAGPNAVVNGLFFDAVSGTSPPAAPTNLSAQAVSASQINLTWKESSTNQTGYYLERSPDGINWHLDATLPATATSYADTGLSPGTKEYYEIQAYNSAGKSAYSNVASAVTLASSSLPPPTGLTATDETSSEMKVSWNTVSGATNYLLERSTNGITWDPIGGGPSKVINGVDSYLDFGLAGNTTYDYRVEATNKTGDSGFSSVARAATSAPPVGGFSLQNGVLTFVGPTGQNSIIVTGPHQLNPTPGTAPDALVVSVNGLLISYPASSVQSVHAYLGSGNNNFMAGYDDTEDPDFPRANFLIFAGSGNDTIWVPTVNAYVDCGSGNDQVTAGVGRDGSTVRAGSGNDYIYLGGAYAGLSGPGPGHVSLFNDGSNNQVYLGSGNAVVESYPFDGTVYGGSGNAIVDLVDSEGGAFIPGSGSVSLDVGTEFHGFAFGPNPGNDLYARDGNYGRTSVDSTPGAGPTFVNPATASSLLVTGNTVNLSALATENGIAPSNITYGWWGSGVKFSANGSNAANNTTATFSTNGVNELRVEAVDPEGRTQTSTVFVVVADPNLPGPSVYANPPMARTWSNLLGGDGPYGYVSGPVSSLRYTFDQAMDPSTITPAAISVTGPNGAIPVTAVTPVPGTANTMFEISFAAQSAPGSYQMKFIKPLTNNLGNSPGALSLRFFSILPLYVTSVQAESPQGAIQVTFDRPVNPATLSALSISNLLAVNGTRLTVQSVTAVPGSNDTEFDISYNTSALGSGNIYGSTFTLSPSITDAYGYAIDPSQGGQSETVAAPVTTATVSDAPAVTSANGNTPYTFSVTYNNPGGVDLSSVSSTVSASTVQIGGVDGEGDKYMYYAATLVSTSVSNNGTTVVAQYQLTAGNLSTWNSSMNGPYEITGNSGLLGLFEVAIPPAPTKLAATPGNGQVTLSWAASTSATSYNLYRGTTSGAETLIASGIAGTSFVDTGVTNNTTYYYEVRAITPTGQSGLSSEASAMPASSKPAAPTGLTAAYWYGFPSLNWKPAEGATSYNVYRGTTSSGLTLYQAGVTSTGYVDYNVVAGTEYYYLVTAVNWLGQSGKSNEVSIKAQA